MKSSGIWIVSALMINIPVQAFGPQEPQEIKSQISEVTVFLKGAQVTRQAKITLQKGTATLAFRELPVNIDPQSIQARGEGDFIILSLLHQVNYLASQRKNLQVKALQDSLRIYEDLFAYNTSIQSVMKSEEELLVANRNIGSTEKGVLMTELKAAADFFRARLTEIKKEQLKLMREAAHLSEKIERIRNQLNTLNAGLSKPTSEILVKVSSAENMSGNLWITYAVNEAGWAPAYDVRVKDIQNPVQLIYNARISQNTGEDWEKVNIRLSTANPQQHGEKPLLNPWYINFEQPLRGLAEYNIARPGTTKRAVAMPETMDAGLMEMKEEEAEAVTIASFTEVNEGQTNLEFNIKLPYDVPSDNKQYTLNIQDNTLPAAYAYYCVPKLDREAFLIAQITGWENYNLLSGEMNLFFEGTYVGKSFLNVRNTSDTLDLSLGRDKSIIVTRVKMKDFTEQKTLGSNKRETRAWEITVRNNKKQAIDLRLEDQLPVSMNKDIQVEPQEYSGGQYNQETGRVSWKFRLEPSGERKFRVAFAVKYPKDQRVFID